MKRDLVISCYMKNYLLFVSHSYAFSILRPLQTEILKRGDNVAWYIEDTSPTFLREGEKQLKTIDDVLKFNPYAIFAPGNHIYDFFPGIKVEIFHGLYYKRTDFGDHYKIRGFFDIYCTTSPLFTPTFKQLSEKYKFFKVYETGWCKFDSYDTSIKRNSENGNPTIIYAPTFSKGITSTEELYPEIRKIISSGKWNWIFSFHPKTDDKTILKYRSLAQEFPNVVFSDTEDKQELYQLADVMVSDSSSVIYEFLWFNKPVVTLKNTFPADHLLNINEASLLEEAIKQALTYPPELIKNIKAFMDIVHPMRDRNAAKRILDSVDDFNSKYKGKIKKKPLNLIRNLKLRKKAAYFPFGRLSK